MPIVFKTEEERNPTNQVAVVNEEPLVVEDLTQSVFEEGEEEKLAIRYIEETAQYQKFMLWCGLQDQLQKLTDSIEE